MSCLIEPPSRFWASDMLSRSFQRRARLIQRLRERRVLRQIRVDRRGENLGGGALGFAIGEGGKLDQRIPVVRLRQRIARPGNVTQNEFERPAATRVRRRRASDPHGL